MHTAACQNFKPAYRHSRNTTIPSSNATDRVTVKQSPPLHSSRHGGRPRSRVVLVSSACLAARPAGTKDAFLACVGTVPGLCAARAQETSPTADNAVSHD